MIPFSTRLLASGLVACFLMVAPDTAALGAPAFKVTTSLDGKTVLPHRIHWRAYTTIPQSQLKIVVFYIDGKLRWFGAKLPVTYSDDGHTSSSNLGGYLVTSWLVPGRHVFSVRAQAKDGRIARDSVTAKVLPTPDPPVALVGAWTRTIDAAGAPKPKSPGNPSGTIPYSGTYRIVLDKRWLALKFPGTFMPSNPNRAFTNYIDWEPGPTKFHLQGAVSIKMLRLIDPFGGWLCFPGGPAADYTWSVSGNTLTLAPIGGKDACGVRGFLLAGSWTKAR